MTWIKTIDTHDAKGRLARLYQRAAGPDGAVDNILKAHSLRPHTLEGHLALYKSVLHHAANRLPKWYLETVGLYVSMLNHCNYCVEHHFVGLCGQLHDDPRAASIRAALQVDQVQQVFAGRELAGLHYARSLTLAPAELTVSAIEKLRAADLDDGEILELNQVSAYFNYANRTVLGLGVTTLGDTLGRSLIGDQDLDNG